MEVAEETQIRGNQDSHRGAPDGRNRKTNIKVLAFLLLTVRCMAGTAAGVYLNCQRAAPVPQQDLTYGVNTASSDTPGKTRGQCWKELDSVVGEDIFVMPMSVTSFGKTTGAGRSISWMTENPSGQRKLIRAEITRDDTGKKILKVRAIRPGSYLESDPLLIPLPAGEYDCTTVFLVYQEGTEILMGQTAVRTKLVLQE